MLKAVETTARSTRLKIKAIQSLQEQVTQKLSADIGPQYPAKLSEVLFEQPYCRIKDVIEGCGVSRPTATKYLNSLVEAEIIEVQRVEIGRASCRERVEVSGDGGSMKEEVG